MKLHISKLKNSSVYKLLLNNYFLISISVLFTILAYNNILWLIALIIYSFYIYRKNKILFYICSGVALIILVHYIVIDLTYEYVDREEIEGYIIEVSDNKITVKDKSKRYIVYNNSNLSLKSGYYIKAKGIASQVESNRLKGGFNYLEYLKNNRINSVVISSDIEIISKDFSLRVIKHYFKEYINKIFPKESSDFLKAIIIGDLNDIDDAFKNAILENGITHLFAISGLHISLFVMFLGKLLSIFKISNRKSELIISFFLVLYLFITSFSPSVLRASLMYYLSIINKRLNLGFHLLDIVSIIFIMLLLYNPLYIYNLGFSLSFLSAMTIILFGDLFKKHNNYLQILFLSIAITIITFPLVININNKINFTTPLINVVFIELVSVIILPLSFIMLAIPIFKNIFNYMIKAFNSLTIFVSKYFVININFPYFNQYLSFIYYVLLFLIIYFYKNKKLRNSFSLTLVIILLVFSNKIYISPKTEVHFLDLADGESTLIIDSYNECIALIDTGDGRNDEVTKYLKREGVKKLNYVFITHEDNDHNGELKVIDENFKIKNIVFNYYDKTNYRLQNKANIIYSKEGDVHKCGRIEFVVLNPGSDNGNSNDNSLVLFTKIGHLSFLFLADVSKHIEEGLNINKKVDVIKVAHHGSNTSTSPTFINRVRPKYAIIMSGRVAKFNFPRKETITTLIAANVTIYRTDLDYSIVYKSYKKKYVFEKTKD